MDKIIAELNKIGKRYISDSFNLRKTKNNLFKYCIEGNSNAYTFKRNDIIPIKVLNWFDDFWIYIEIEFKFGDISIFKKKKDFPNIIFSLSVFQWASEEENKIQLFRAEWDNYEDSQSHAQPHWHIYTDYDKEKIDKSFEEEIKADEEGSFSNSIKYKKEKIAINRFHFAMNGQWADQKDEFHKVNDSRDLIYWFSGLILHIENELKYLIEKT